ncbi:hypothetical protein TNCV_4011441 [Trichonephila clavipes]|nr:hypothetical protein TNCV_4011441 [Trichonephila clavipes]
MDDDDINKNIFILIRNAQTAPHDAYLKTYLVLRKDISDKRIVYFKILNNSEIVQYIHNDAQEECFGFCKLHRTDPNDKFKVFSPNKHLFVNLLDCVLEARDITSDKGDCPRFLLQFGYFKLLTNDELVKLFHIL